MNTTQNEEQIFYVEWEIFNTINQGKFAEAIKMCKTSIDHYTILLDTINLNTDSRKQLTNKISWYKAAISLCTI